MSFGHTFGGWLEYFSAPPGLNVRKTMTGSLFGGMLPHYLQTLNVTVLDSYRAVLLWVCFNRRQQA